MPPSFLRSPCRFFLIILIFPPWPYLVCLFYHSRRARAHTPNNKLRRMLRDYLLKVESIVSGRSFNRLDAALQRLCAQPMAEPLAPLPLNYLASALLGDFFLFRNSPSRLFKIPPARGFSASSGIKSTLIIVLLLFILFSPSQKKIFSKVL